MRIVVVTNEALRAERPWRPSR